MTNGDFFVDLEANTDTAPDVIKVAFQDGGFDRKVLEKRVEDLCRV
jgi:hypothetical protein